MPKDREINHLVAKRIAQHKLRKPLASSVALDRSVDVPEIFNLLESRLEELKLGRILDFRVYQSQASEVLESAVRFPLIAQKMTVMAHTLPEQFMRSLLCACFSLGLCRELSLDGATLERVFLANLIADLGLLHIEPAVVTKRGNYSPDEWRLMKGHVVISKAIADLEVGLDPRVSRSVLEHHERIDGFGYPFGRRGNELSFEGRIVAMSDTVSALYRKLVLEGGRCEMAVLAVLELPTSAHDGAVRNAVLRMLKRLDVPYVPGFRPQDTTRIIAGLIEKRRRLKNWIKHLLGIYRQHALELEQSSLVSVNLADQLVKTVGSTGLLSGVQEQWLASLAQAASAQDIRELEEYQLKIDELEYQCRFILNALGGEIEKLSRLLTQGANARAYFNELSTLLSGNTTASP